MKNTMNRDEFVAYLRKRQISVSEFYTLLNIWFSLTKDERWDLIKNTEMYRNLKR